MFEENIKAEMFSKIIETLKYLDSGNKVRSRLERLKLYLKVVKLQNSR